jgi:hypothetical protein
MLAIALALAMSVVATRIFFRLNSLLLAVGDVNAETLEARLWNGRAMRSRSSGKASDGGRMCRETQNASGVLDYVHATARDELEPARAWPQRTRDSITRAQPLTTSLQLPNFDAVGS